MTFSDSSGFIVDEQGIDESKLAFVLDLKNNRRGRIKEYTDKFKGAHYQAIESNAKHNPLWELKCDVALPCATQNEINLDDANHLVKNGCYCVAEGANMPSTPEAVGLFIESKILYAPGKASNAGGVAVSGLEMSQNSMRMSWSREEVDQKLHTIMKSIHKTCVDIAAAYGTPGNYVNGANIGGFLKIADSMLAQGVV
jgi:glutamate dehydrogenase (NADP+)